MHYPIQSKSAYLEAISGKEELICSKQQVDGTEVHCVFYVYSDKDTFNSPAALEARGITFQGESVINRPFHKFFNVNERDSTQLEKLPAKPDLWMLKRDGSMTSPSLLNGKVVFKTKKSFTSDVANGINAWVSQPAQAHYMAFAKAALEQGICPIFEWTTPDPAQRIVIGYKEYQLSFLNARELISGKYRPDLAEMAQQFGVPVVDQFDVTHFSWDRLMHEKATREGIEGWVLGFWLTDEKGNRYLDFVKVKTDWYVALHRTITFVRERDIAKLALSEQLDDLKAKYVELGLDLSMVEAIESRLKAALNQIHQEVNLALDRAKTRLGVAEFNPADREQFKQLAASLKAHQYFGLIMSMARGVTPDIVSYYEKHHLDRDFTLEQLAAFDHSGKLIDAEDE